MRWFTSDLHLSHARASELCGRPFADVDEMNDALISKWNAKVSQDDVVYVLGDFALGKIADSLPLGLQLNGTKHLIVGNHDRPFIGLKPGKEEKGREWAERYVAEGGFSSVQHQLVLTIAGEEVLLSHFPYQGDSQFEDRYVEARPVDAGGWLLHGHIHSRVRRTGSRMIHVGVDAWDFEPVPEDAIVQLMSSD